MGTKAVKQPANKDTTTAEDVAKAMAANLAANQQDPNWELEHEKMQHESAQEALWKHGLHPNQKKKE
jgi:hypothetical protein